MSLLISGPYNQVTSPVQRGFNSPQCQRQTGRWSPTTGWTFDQEFRGLSTTQMNNLATQFGAAGIEYELTTQNGIATMRTVDTTGNVTIDTWEINASQTSTSIFKNPLIMAALGSNDLAVLASAYLTGHTADAELQTVVNTLNADSPPTPLAKPDVSGSNATARVWSMIKNSDDMTYYADIYSLRHTTNASNRGYYNVADTNVNCLYTQAQLLSEIGNSSYWIFPAPAEIVGAINSIFSQIGTTPANFLKSALKGGSSRVTAANNRVNITTEYKLYNWSTDLYASAV